MSTGTQADERAAIEAEPCGCPACDDGVQPGHFACEQASEKMIAGEQIGMFARAYDDDRWRWFRARRSSNGH